MRKEKEKMEDEMESERNEVKKTEMMHFIPSEPGGFYL